VTGAFRVEAAGTGIAHLVMDDPGRRVNVLDEAAFDSLESSLTQLEQEPSLRGVMVRSGKPGSFVAGADVHAIGSITEPFQLVGLTVGASIGICLQKSRASRAPRGAASAITK